MRGFLGLSIPLAITLAAGPAAGGSPYTLSITDATGSPGLPVEVLAILESTGSPVQGWSFGICHDPALLEFADSQNGIATLTAKNGAPADFTQVNALPGGITMGAVICFTACAALPPGVHELLEIEYLPLGATGTTATLAYCSTLGSPLIHTVVVVNGSSQIPLQIPGAIAVVSPNDLRVGTVFGAPGSTVAVPVLLTNVTPADGVQIALGFDPAVLTLLSVEPVGAAVGAAFFAIPPGLAPGELGCGLVMDFTPPLDDRLPAVDAPIVEAAFTIAAGAAAPLSSPLAFQAEVGDPPISNTLVSGQVQDLPNLIDGSVEVAVYHPFVRGDCNRDWFVNIADGITVLYHLFVGTILPPCLDACDANDDGTLDAADPITVFAYQFTDGPPPPPPFPAPGIDPTPGEGIGCDGDLDD